MVLKNEVNEENKKMKSKIYKYLQKNLSNQLSKNCVYFILTERDIKLKYFFWLNNESFFYINKGFCIKVVRKKYYHMNNFLLYYFLKNMKINQLFFNSSPFIFFLQKAKIKKKK
jgi:hypothetical protein